MKGLSTALAAETRQRIGEGGLKVVMEHKLGEAPDQLCGGLAVHCSLAYVNLPPGRPSK
jgi:hypothetical protein